MIHPVFNQVSDSRNESCCSIGQAAMQESKTGPRIEAEHLIHVRRAGMELFIATIQLSEIFKTLPELLQWNRQTYSVAAQGWS